MDEPKEEPICRQYRRRVDDLQEFISLDARLDSFEPSATARRNGTSCISHTPYPHNSKKLNPTTLAKAGFVRGSAQFMEPNDLLKNVPLEITIEDEEDDTVFCPYCFKHLSDFEPDDQPFQEHKDHKANCIFINQVASVRARTSLWMDPLNTKPSKNKKDITVGAIQDMRNTASKAHWEYVENFQKTTLQEEAVLSSQLWLLNNLKRRRKSVRKDMIRSAFSKGTFSKLAMANQAIGESPKIDPRSIPKSELCQVSSLPLAKIIRQLSEKSDKIPVSTLSKKSRAPLQGISANYKFSPANSVLPERFMAKSKENVTPLMARAAGVLHNASSGRCASSTPYGTHNQTISITKRDVPQQSSAVADNVHMSPGTPVVGKSKTMYMNIGGGRVLPVPVLVDSANVKELKRLSRVDFNK